MENMLDRFSPSINGTVIQKWGDVQSAVSRYALEEITAIIILQYSKQLQQNIVLKYC